MLLILLAIHSAAAPTPPPKTLEPGYGHTNAPVEIDGDKGRATIKLAEVNARQYAVTIVQSSGAERDAFAGSCDVTAIAQSPLTEAEAEIYVRDPDRIP